MESHKALDLSIQEVVYAGLQALQAVAALDLCAYLHSSQPSGPQLFLGTPALAAASGAKAFTIFSELKDALDRPHFLSPGALASGPDDTVTEIASHPALVVLTVGVGSRGVHAVGRDGAPFDDGERAALTRLCLALGEATHRLQQAVLDRAVK
ncbi:MAG: hypothetical protein QOF60_85 [Actinomycetota bacterium]|jgi:hypothetical protein|nr:hypothetical protein [Actinomycetota bacterium]